MKRRDFLLSSAAVAGTIMIPFPWGCKKNAEIITPIVKPHFDYLEVSGTHYEIGKQIGDNFSSKIIASHEGIKELIDAVNSIVAADPATFYDPFVEAAQNHFPDYVDEIQGIADGAGLTFQDIMISNMAIEILYYYYELTGNMKYKLDESFGCSTVSYSKDWKLYLAHNEDLFTCFLDYMYVTKIKVNGKPEIINLNYPGLLPGIPPGMNEAGIVQSGNDISGLHIEPSVPMAFHFRSVLDSTSLDDAKERASFPHRARTMNHNIGSFVEDKIISVEAAPSKNQTQIVDEFYVHTNHYILPEMTDIPLDPSGLESSESRFNVLTSKAQAYADKPDEVTGELITSFLSSHDGAPLSPCVHDNNGASTLAHSLFDFDKKTWNLYFSNPCLNNAKLFNL
ncbi:MAG: C45 family peptidase [Bacteroidales bacterium]|nr:C45 family peptidase [Bacteroidales bacterium]